MTADAFRKLALRMPEAREGSHMGHPDFRVGGKIFATLDAKGERGMVKVTPEQQSVLVHAEPDVYLPCPGAWGRQGCTFVTLKAAKVASVRSAVKKAHQNTLGARSRRG